MGREVIQLDAQLIGIAFQVAEKWLYNYNRWRAELFILQDALADASGKVTTGFGTGGSSEPSDGTFVRVTNVIEAELKLPALLNKVKILEIAIDSLGDEQRNLVQLKYFRVWTNQMCWEHLRLSEREFYRERRQAVSQISQILLNGLMFLLEVEERLERYRKLG